MYLNVVLYGGNACVTGLPKAVEDLQEIVATLTR